MLYARGTAIVRYARGLRLSCVSLAVPYTFSPRGTGVVDPPQKGSKLPSPRRRAAESGVDSPVFGVDSSAPSIGFAAQWFSDSKVRNPSSPSHGLAGASELSQSFHGHPDGHNVVSIPSRHEAVFFVSCSNFRRCTGAGCRTSVRATVSQFENLG